MPQEIPAISAISLWQPWASLMFHQAKMIETRHWKTKPGQFLAIHAAKKWGEELSELSQSIRFRKYLAGQEIPRGVFGAIGYLEECISTMEWQPATELDEYWFGDYSAGRFGWKFSKIWTLPAPIPAQGRQSVWKLNAKEALSWLTPEQKQNLIEFWEQRRRESGK